jgi:hypothetical protein
VSELAAVAAVLRCLAEIGEGDGALARLHRDIHRRQGLQAGGGLRDARIYSNLFTGQPGTAGAGASVSLLARLPDGRGISWTVEVWIDTWDAGGPWSAEVKGDVDRDLTDEPFADDECLFLEQRTVHDVAGIQSAAREMAELVVAQAVV